MTTMNYDGYVAEIDIDAENGVLSGIVLNTRATLHFSGRSVDDLRAAFKDTVDEYRDWCRAEGEEPEKPYSGALSLRIDPALHRRLAAKAASEHVSINALISGALEKVA